MIFDISKISILPTEYSEPGMEVTKNQKERVFLEIITVMYDVLGLTRCQNWALFCSFYNQPSFYMIFLSKLSNQKYNWSTIIQNPGFANERNRTTLMRNSLKKKTRNCIRIEVFPALPIIDVQERFSGLRSEL